MQVVDDGWQNAGAIECQYRRPECTCPKGAQPFRHRCTVSASLKNIWSGTSSQWSSSCSTWPRPRSNFQVPVMTRAAAFNTRCNLSVTVLGAPARTVFCETVLAGCPPDCLFSNLCIFWDNQKRFTFSLTSFQHVLSNVPSHLIRSDFIAAQHLYWSWFLHTAYLQTIPVTLPNEQTSLVPIWALHFFLSFKVNPNVLQICSCSFYLTLPHAPYSTSRLHCYISDRILTHYLNGSQ